MKIERLCFSVATILAILSGTFVMGSGMFFQTESQILGTRINIAKIQLDNSVYYTSNETSSNKTSENKLYQELWDWQRELGYNQDQAKKRGQILYHAAMIFTLLALIITLRGAISFSSNKWSKKKKSRNYSKSK